MDLLSNRLCLKQINQNFDSVIELVQSTHKPLQLSSEEFLEIREASVEFLQEFNGTNQHQQIQLLININDSSRLWKFLSLNPTSYDTQTFIEELYQLASKSLLVKQHLAFHVEDFLLILGVSYDDTLRFGCFKVLALLISDPQPQSKQTISRFNRMCYECLYDFHIYYEKIKPFTIESCIIDLTKEDAENLINGKIIRKDLETQIMKAINELDGDVCFKMRRSPKDAYQALCKEIDDQWIDIWGLKANDDPRLYFMKIQNMSQLKVLFKTSDRLRQDLDDSSSNEKLILRKWIDHLPSEYRCFVCNGKINAVSQYGSKENLANELGLTDFINSKRFQDIILSIPYSHGVVDCSIDSENFQVKIIEINPFGKRSSAGKFSWIIDQKILYDHYQINGYVNVKL